MTSYGIKRAISMNRLPIHRQRLRVFSRKSFLVKTRSYT